MVNRQTPFVLYGGDYNPDQWDEVTLEKDIEYFKKAHINTVTLPVFSWAKLEPKEGIYDFDWLDRILERLWVNRIYVILSTPTSAQPAWMSNKYPEVLPVDIKGRKRTHGMRVFFCVNSVKYRERARAIAGAMGKRYANFPGLVAWHVANEYGTFCYCENCQQKFRGWLQNRYKSINELNERWHTNFWGKNLYNFDEVMLPTELNDDYRFNPSVQLDYMRFVTDSTIDCYTNEAEILRGYSLDKTIFTNISGFIKKLNQFKMVEYMDFAGWDNYPSPSDPPSFPAMKHDIMRGAKAGKSYIVAEQSPNQQNWQPYNKLKRPGQLRTIAYQGLAHGGDTCLYFQMRQSIAGQEKFHGAFISHSGRDDTRIFRELSKLGSELEKLGDVFLDGRTDSQVGFLFDWENWWALELTSGPTKDMDYLTQVHSYYKAFHTQNISMDMLKLKYDLSSYKVIVAPLLYMEHQDIAEKVKVFVKNGGTFIATYMTGIADENDRCVFGAYPGKYREVFGIYVEETDALRVGETNALVLQDGFLDAKDGYVGHFLCDLIKTEGAEVLATYGEDFYKGVPCITCNTYGKGKAYYFGTQPDDQFLEDFVGQLSCTIGLHGSIKCEKGVEVTYRTNAKGTVYFVINHMDEKRKVQFGNAVYQDLLMDQKWTKDVLLNPRDVLVLKRL
ncbi:MAG: beta-galactosidase [Clostridiales bacterium]